MSWILLFVAIFLLIISRYCNNANSIIFGLSREKSRSTVYHNSLIPMFVCYDNVPQAFMELTPSRGNKMRCCCFFGWCQLGGLALSTPNYHCHWYWRGEKKIPREKKLIRPPCTSPLIYLVHSSCCSISNVMSGNKYKTHCRLTVRPHYSNCFLLESF